jgi:hypothetical protein
LLNELTHRTKAGLRNALAVAMILAFVLCSMPSAFAQVITGNIQGTITSSQGNTKLAGVQVTAAAPSGRYTATTDATGFFSIQGVTPDTYSITFSRTGYETFTLTGVTVVQGQAANASTALNQSLQRIGRTQARSTTGAFQPTQTTDQYNVGTAQITTTLGKQGGTSESNLLASIPGASFDSSGYPVLRGGRETEEGFQYEGIDYTDAFTHQFVNSLILNGASNFQVTPGAGDASIGNVGTGAINIVAKRGTNPKFGQFEGDLRAGRYEHQLRGEYGWATPNGRYSEYVSGVFDRNSYNYGGTGANPLLIGCAFSCRIYDKSNELTNNFVYKFGTDNNQSLQAFYDNTQFDLKLGLSQGPVGPFYPTNDALWVSTAFAFNFVNNTQAIQAVTPLVYGQRFLTDRIGAYNDRRVENGSQPNETMKLQYSNSLNATTFLTAKFYRVNSVVQFDNPLRGNSVQFDDASSQQGGQRTGIAFDGTKQMGSKNLLGFGGKYEYLTPIFSFPTATGAFYAFTGGGGGSSIESQDFYPSGLAGGCPFQNPATGANLHCGYLFGFGYSGVSKGCPLNLATGTNVCTSAVVGSATGPLAPAISLPYADESTHTPRQDIALYLKDTFSPTDRLKFDVGIRMDGVNWRSPSCDINWCLPTSFTTDSAGNNTYQFNYSKDTRTPRVWQPRFAFSYQFTRNDSIRGTYGRSVQFAPIAAIDATSSDTAYKSYRGIPSVDQVNHPIAAAPFGTAATFCGTSIFLGFQDQTCKDYAQQLYWENQQATNGVPITPLLPTTFNNYDFTYSHQFPHGVAVKITPFYTKSFNQVASTAQPLIQNGIVVTNPVTGAPVLGPAVQSNLGKNQVTGVEFFLTKEAAYGLSGSLSMTYQNEFSNVVPTSASEDFFPSIPPASLQLGNLYRVGFLSPFVGTLSLQERTRSGWRINPVIYYNHGYPYGAGLLTAATVNGLPYNVPNTNITNSSQLSAAAGATRYVDPRNPGSAFAPNIAATRGTPENTAAGGELTAARFYPTQLTIEYQSPRNPRSTYGALIFNLFNQLYAQPALNTRYQPIATGIAGPYSGYSASAVNPVFYGVRNFTAVRGNQAYLLQPTNQPRTVQFYYQLNL